MTEERVRLPSAATPRAALLVVGALLLARPLAWRSLATALPTGSWPGALVLLLAALALLPVVALARGRRVDASDVCWWLLLAAATWSAAMTPPTAQMWCSYLPYVGAAAAWSLFRLAPVEPRTAAAIAAAAASACATALLLEAAHLWPLLPARYGPGGLVDNKNFAAEYIALALPACLRVAERGWRRGLVVLLVFALIVTRCRTAWVAAGSGVAVYAILRLGDRAAWRRLGWSSALVAIGVVLAVYVPRTRITIESTEKATNAAALHHLVDFGAGTGRLRALEYRTALTLAWRERGGALGPGQWLSEGRRIDREAARGQIPHSDYLRALTDGGIAAAAALVAAYLSLFVAAYRVRRQTPEACATVVALALVSITDAPLYRLESTALVLLLLASVNATCTTQPAAVNAPSARARIPATRQARRRRRALDRKVLGRR